MTYFRKVLLTSFWQELSFVKLRRYLKNFEVHLKVKFPDSWDVRFTTLKSSNQEKNWESKSSDFNVSVPGLNYSQTLATSSYFRGPCYKSFCKKMDQPRPLFRFFGLFKQTIQFLLQINVKKCPSSIRRWDSNPRPFKHESSPVTTRPGLPPVL